MPALLQQVRPHVPARAIVLAALLVVWHWGVASTESETLPVTDATVKQLRHFRGEAKFHQDARTLYPGAPNEAVRFRCETQLNALIDRLIAGLPSHPTRQYVLEQFRTTMPLFAHEDSEEQDQMLHYMERIMKITGIPSSDGLLNRWRYGFDP